MKKHLIWIHLNKNKLFFAFLFLGVLLLGNLFIIRPSTEIDVHKPLYPLTNDILHISYKELYGLPALDSSTPILNGIELTFQYKVKNEIFENEIFIPLEKLNNDLIELINSEAFDKIKVSYLPNHPKKSKVFIKDK